MFTWIEIISFVCLLLARLNWMAQATIAAANLCSTSRLWAQTMEHTAEVSFIIHNVAIIKLSCRNCIGSASAQPCVTEQTVGAHSERFLENTGELIRLQCLLAGLGFFFYKSTQPPHFNSSRSHQQQREILHHTITIPYFDQKLTPVAYQIKIFILNTASPLPLSLAHHQNKRSFEPKHGIRAVLNSIHV